MLKRTDWRALQATEATPAGPMQLELPFPRSKPGPDSPQLVLLFPSDASARAASSPGNAGESSGGTRHTDDKRSE